MIAPTEKDWILLGLEAFHNKTLLYGVDMDKIQITIGKSLPKFTLFNGLITVLVSILFWVNPYD